jgi:hypothetical protein
MCDHPGYAAHQCPLLARTPRVDTHSPCDTLPWRCDCPATGPSVEKMVPEFIFFTGAVAVDGMEPLDRAHAVITALTVAGAVGVPAADEMQFSPPDVAGAVRDGVRARGYDLPLVGLRAVALAVNTWIVILAASALRVSGGIVEPSTVLGRTGERL